MITNVLFQKSLSAAIGSLFLLFALMICPGSVYADDNDLTPEGAKSQLLPVLERHRDLISHRLRQLETFRWQLQSGQSGVSPQVLAKALTLLGESKKHMQTAKDLTDFALDNVHNYIETGENRFIVLSQFDSKDAGGYFNRGVQLAQQSMRTIKGLQ